MADERTNGRTERARRTPPPRRSGTGASRRRGPQLTRTRPRGVVAATTGMLGLSSTRHAAVLAIVVCALALTVAVPLRNFMTQRQELAAVSAQQQALAVEVDELARQRARLSDPAEIAAQARSRLGYVTPGEVPYVVQLPVVEAGPVPDPDSGLPWFQQLWREVAGGRP